MRRRRPDHLIRNLLIGSLIILAAMHPTGTGHLAQIATGLVLAIADGILAGAAQHLGAAALIAGLGWILLNARTHRPHTRRTHP
ncbi:hypothetical protein AQI95_24740 [Streptomyces yokosukanensis]|uniref:Uncharacterized protein n=1 Tax=Streptomyces yokosukanensis TaxID=67386 RepID=A0A101P1F7_9ACTN|nr:hypothetical protein [Streptomyces yokosukanensis]KUN03167.1 hypothetical protein AQI95_24740 [Streptomyces yokosukanensis]